MPLSEKEFLDRCLPVVEPSRASKTILAKGFVGLSSTLYIAASTDLNPSTKPHSCNFEPHKPLFAKDFCCGFNVGL